MLKIFQRLITSTDRWFGHACKLNKWIKLHKPNVRFSQAMETSLVWRQCGVLPHQPWRQRINDVSCPLHTTSSSQIWPEPGPYKLPSDRPLRLQTNNVYILNNTGRTFRPNHQFLAACNSYVWTSDADLYQVWWQSQSTSPLSSSPTSRCESTILKSEAKSETTVPKTKTSPSLLKHREISSNVKRRRIYIALSYKLLISKCSDMAHVSARLKDDSNQWRH